MIAVPMTLLNEHASALQRVLPELMDAMMAETGSEGITPERTDDLTMSRAVLGNLQQHLTKELAVIARLEREERAQERKGARAKFARTRTRIARPA
jgi:hypothetical protein